MVKKSIDVEQIRKQVEEKYGHSRLLNLIETAEVLGYAVTTTRRLASQRVFPVVKLKKSVRVDPEELFAWIEAQKVEA